MAFFLLFLRKKLKIIYLRERFTGAIYGNEPILRERTDLRERFYFFFAPVRERRFAPVHLPNGSDYGSDRFAPVLNSCLDNHITRTKRGIFSGRKLLGRKGGYNISGGLERGGTQ